MSTEEISLVSPQNGINSQLLFQDDPLRFNCTGPPPQQQQQRRVGDPKTRELTGFIDDNKLFSSTTTATATSTAGSDRYFPSHHHHHHHHHHQDFPRNVYQREPQGTSGDDTDGEDDEDDEEDDEEEVDDVDGGDHENGVDVLVAAIDCNSKNTNCNNNNCSGTISNASNSVHLDKIGNGNAKPKHLSSFGISGEMVKDGIGGGGGGLGQTGNNAVTIAEADGEMYYSQYLQGTGGSGAGGKDMGVENGCGFSGRKEVSAFSSESGDSLRAILSDPVTGALMDDAMILPCGHSFGAGGMQHVIRMKVCYSCSQSISEDSIAPNLSLRYAVQAFQREEELQFYRSSKRRRERFDQDKGGYGDSGVMDPPRGRGVQFPFAVTDRVIIKGNKRTPQRFVGREAVVTTQCLNGWYVVKTLDNAESVKLQYRSLAKLSDDPSSKTISTKIAPNWL